MGVLRTETRTITPAMAREMRNTMHYPRQRNIRDDNVRRLAREMAMGRFIPGLQIYIGVLADGRMWILNGNHTLEAIATAGTSQLVSITYHECANEDEAHRIYAVFDVHKLRSWRDTLNASGKTDPGAEKVAAAVGMIQNKFEQLSRPIQTSRLDRIDLMEHYSDAAELFFAERSQSRTKDAAKLVLRAGVMSVALETIKYNPVRGVAFWGAVMKDDGLKTGDPAKALLQYLRGNKAAGHSDRAENARASAAAWNAFLQGRKIKYVKPNSMVSFYLLATPWEKGVENRNTERPPATHGRDAALGV